MTRFIWVRDIDKNDNYINVNHIVRVTKIPARASYPVRTYLVLNEDGQSAKYMHLADDAFDTYEDVIAKIQVASA